MTDIRFEKVRRDSFYYVSREVHQELEIYYLTEGERLYFVENRSYHLAPGSVLLISSNRIHKTSALGSDPHTRMLLEINPSFLKRMESNFPSVSLQRALSSTSLLSQPGTPWNAEIRQQFDRIHELSASQPYAYQQEIECAVFSILLCFQRIALSAEKESAIHSPMYEKIYEVAEYLSSHMDTVENLDALCETMFISKYYLCHNFKEVTGMSVIAFLNVIRIRRAKVLLTETELDMQQIAEATGLGNAARFSVLFKRSEGLSPRDYRKQSKPGTGQSTADAAQNDHEKGNQASSSPQSGALSFPVA